MVRLALRRSRRSNPLPCGRSRIGSSKERPPLTCKKSYLTWRRSTGSGCSSCMESDDSGLVTPSSNGVTCWSRQFLSRRMGQVSAIVGPAEPGGVSSGESCAEAVVRLRMGDHQECWLLSDGWWADTFLAPSYGELVLWSIRALPWAIALQVARNYWNTIEDGLPSRRVFATAFAVIKLVGASLLSPLFVLLLVLTLIFGLIPVPQLRRLILSAQGTLASTVGDSFAFVESPVRGALIRTRLLNALARLKERCERTIIVAHSQGAAVVLDALHACDGQASQSTKATRSNANPISCRTRSLLSVRGSTNSQV